MEYFCPFGEGDYSPAQKSAEAKESDSCEFFDTD